MSFRTAALMLLCACTQPPPPAGSSSSSSSSGAVLASASSGGLLQSSGASSASAASEMGSSTSTTSSGTEGHGLPVIHTADPVRAARGAAVFTDGHLGRLAIPRQAMDNLWIVWGTGFPANYAAAFRARYGLEDAPWSNDGYPMGIRPLDQANVTLDCMLCHATQVAGTTVVGAANSRLDLQGLFDDLKALGQMYGYSVPWNLTDRTGAAGANDAMGLGFSFSKLYVPNAAVHDAMGPRKAFMRRACF